MNVLRALTHLPRKTRISVAAYITWVLLLLLTNSFQFDDIFEWSGYYGGVYIRRLLWFASIPPVFAFVIYGLYAWATRPESESAALSPETKKVRKQSVAVKNSQAEAWRPRKLFYMKRAAAFLLLAAVSFLFGHVVLHGLGFSVGNESNILLSAIALLVLPVFSRPLGFWRKMVCWVAGVAAFVFPVSTVVAGVFWFAGNAMSLTSILGSGLIVYLLSFALGAYTLKKTQDRWRRLIQEGG